MGGNPLLLVFLGIGIVLLVALGGLAVLQRRMFRDQARQVEELLREARRLHLQDEDGGDGPDAGPGRDD